MEKPVGDSSTSNIGDAIKFQSMPYYDQESGRLQRGIRGEQGPQGVPMWPSHMPLEISVTCIVVITVIITVIALAAGMVST